MPTLLSHTRSLTHLHTYIHALTHSHITHAHAHAHTHTCTRVHTHTNTRTHAHTHTCTRMHTHTHTHTHRAAAMTLRTVLLSIQALLQAAEPDDPQDAVVARQYKDDPDIYWKTAKHWAQIYAGGKMSHSHGTTQVLNFRSIMSYM